MIEHKKPIEGVLLLDKPTEMTSHDVVQKVRRILGQREVGHCGTLDPMASGLLVLLLGQATKLSDYLLTQDKAYLVKLRFGLTTDTLDRTGKVLTETPVDLTLESIKTALQSALGDLDLPVPAYSAVKIDGKKLYEYARENEAIESPVRRMSFYDLKIVEITATTAMLEIHCSKGSYIRAWAAYVGELLKVGAVLDDLRRLESFPFSVQKAVSLDNLRAQLEGEEKSPALLAQLFPDSFMYMAEALPHWKGLTLGGKDEKMLLNGQLSHEVLNRLIVEQKDVNRGQKTIHVKALSASGKLMALLEVQPFKTPKIKRVFPS